VPSPVFRPRLLTDCLLSFPLFYFHLWCGFLSLRFRFFVFPSYSSMSGYTCALPHYLGIFSFFFSRFWQLSPCVLAPAPLFSCLECSLSSLPMLFHPLEDAFLIFLLSTPNPSFATPVGNALFIPSPETGFPDCTTQQQVRIRAVFIVMSYPILDSDFLRYM